MTFDRQLGSGLTPLLPLRPQREVIPRIGSPKIPQTADKAKDSLGLVPKHSVRPSAQCHTLPFMPNVSLTPELERFAAVCVDSGRYASVSEVALVTPSLGRCRINRLRHRRPEIHLPEFDFAANAQPIRMTTFPTCVWPFK